MTKKSLTERAKAFAERIKKQDLKTTASQAVSIASEMSGLVVSMRGRPGPLALASMAAKAYSVYQGMNPTAEPHPYNEWVKISCPMVRELVEILQEKNLLERDLENPDTSRGKNFKTDLYGSDIRIILDDNNGVYGPYIKEPELEPEVLRAIGRFFWESLGTHLEYTGEYDEGCPLCTDHLTDSLPSECGKQLWERTEKFLKKGYSRAVLLYGPPGTGKSHMMRYVASLAGGFVLRISSDQALHSHYLLNIIKILMPRVILFDDIDRVRDLSTFLSKIETIRLYTPMLLASANRVRDLDPAVIRPGRFDDLMEIRKLDTDIQDRLIGEVPENLRERLQGIPVSYLDEFRRRADVLGEAQALEEVEALIQRAEHSNSAEWSFPSIPKSPPPNEPKDSEEAKEKLEYEKKRMKASRVRARDHVEAVAVCGSPQKG